jgi:hypothetical protein
MDGFCDSTGTDAARAYPQTFRFAVHDRMNLLEIGKPAPLADIVGVADLVPGIRAFSADVAHSRHDFPHQSRIHVLDHFSIKKYENLGRKSRQN